MSNLSRAPIGYAAGTNPEGPKGDHHGVVANGHDQASAPECDGVLVERARTGDRTAFGVLVARHRSLTRAVCRRGKGMREGRYALGSSVWPTTQSHRSRPDGNSSSIISARSIRKPTLRRRR